jgi:succinate-semialdehyde dehydrogenase/glutarate-semialdehyde dehydrogenase
MAFISTNPFTGELLGSFEELSSRALNEKLAFAQEVYNGWSVSSLDERINRLFSLAKHLESQKDRYATWITKEMGKLVHEAEAEIDKCALMCRYYGENAPAFLAERKVKQSGLNATVRYKSQGLILGIMPWNFPFWQVFRFAIPNLMLGNVVAVKHASNVGFCSELIEEAFVIAGFPKGCYQNLFVSHNQVEDIVASEVVRGVSLTGSTSAGSIVAELAGKHLKKCVLELGGSNAMIITKNADLNLAISLAIKGRLINAGQSCIASKRFIVDQEVELSFTEKLISALEDCKAGNPLNRDTRLAPLAREDLVIELSEQVSNAVLAGGEVLLDGQHSQCLFDLR